MKTSQSLIDSLKYIDRMSTAGRTRHVGSEMLLALARGEIGQDKVEAAAKIIAAEAMHMRAEIDIHVKAQLLREKGVELARLPQLGLMVIAEPQQ